MTLQFLQEKDLGFFYTILCSSSSPILITDALSQDNPIIFVNHAFETITGYTANEVLGENCRILQGNDRAQPARQKIASALQLGHACECIIRNYRKNGEMFWNQLYLFPVHDQSGRITNFVGIQHDISTTKSLMAALEEKQTAIETSIDIYLKIGADAIVLEANQAVQNVFGWSPEELIGEKVYKLVPEERLIDAQKNLSTQLQQSRPQAIEGEYLRKDGTKAFVEWMVSKGTGNNSIICMGRDVTEKYLMSQEALRANHRVLTILNSITEGCFSLDHQWKCTYINDQGAKWLRVEPQDLIGKNIWDAFPEAVGGDFYRTYHDAMQSNRYAQCESYYSPLGMWLEARAYPSPDGLTVFFADITGRKTVEEELIYAATHDQLTGLINRTTCLEKLNEFLETAKTEQKPLAVLFIDLDHFKEINDAFGHQAGDKVLIILGERLKNLASAQHMPARISGDEFIFILPETTVKDAEAFSRKVIQAIVQPIPVMGTEVAVGASVGIAVTTGQPVFADDLINQADTAMYKAKAAGRHTSTVYSPEVSQWNKKRLQLRQELLPALHANQFVLHYQPQIRLADNQVVGVEALIRWQHPELGLLSPAAFIDIAEESPLIIDIGTWIVDEACRQLNEWRQSGHNLKMSVNVSARQLGDPNLPQVMENCTRKYGLDTHCIMLEVTESMLAQDFQVSSQILEQLKQKGFGIALDDFGTGYSNLAYIKRFPVMAMKIDRSFIVNLDQDKHAVSLINGIIALAKSLELTVICEGIETELQKQILSQTQCDMIQGYLIAKPTSAKEFFQRFLLNRDKNILTDTTYEPLR